MRMVKLLLVVCACTGPILAQQSATVQGTVTDESGGVIPAAAVTLTDSGGKPRTGNTNENGVYTFRGIAPGKYTVTIAQPGFSEFSKSVDVAAGAVAAVDAPLQVTLERQEVTVAAEDTTTVTTDPTQNAGAIVLRGEDLESLSDDPDALAADLQALAGPSAGPNGGQIYIDGFSGARLPPKESIREIRINQNPFSAEYDRLGYGRIEVFTRPGTDKFHGQAMFSFSDDALNSRNPYAVNRAPFQSRIYGLTLGGPLSKRSSYFIDMDRRGVDDNAVINATILDPSLNVVRFQQAVVTPQQRTSIRPRLDFALNQNNTLVARYNFVRIGSENSGIGDFSLLSRGITSLVTEHTMQLTETAVLNPTMINETRLQFMRRENDRQSDSSDPSVNVLGAFMGGGSQMGRSYDRDNRWELHNVTSIARGTHAVKIGGRLRVLDTRQITEQNFGGAFTFAGAFAPSSNDPSQLERISSIEQYRRTLLFMQRGLSPDQIRALGGGATQFTVAGGNPLAGLNQYDGAIFVQDDWRARPNLTVSLGLRYEAQTNVHDWSNVAPRIGIAWAPGTRGGRTGKTVIRGGVGMFYDRVESDLSLQTVRYNGLNQQQFIVRDPQFYPNIPDIASLESSQQPQTIYRLSPSLRVPYMIQGAIGVERQLPRNTTLAVTYTNTRALHLLRSANLAAPLPGTTVRVLPDNVYEYESSGRMNQHQLMTNVNTRFSRKLSLFGFYVLNKAKSDTDGPGTFAANPFDYRPEYGRASNDIRHRFVLGGNIIAPWGLRFNPFVIARSGSPFNMTTGQDLNADTIFSDRPAFANIGDAGAIATPYGVFDVSPSAGQQLIPRNYAEGPGYFNVNLRASKTVGFGHRQANVANAGAAPGDRGHGGMRRGGFRGGGGGMHGSGFRSIMAEGGSDYRYNLTFSVSFHNLLNTVNPAAPVGNLSSALFGQSTQLAGGFGPGADANNRRVDLQVRLTF
jgi:hypothetical protein